MSEYVSAAERLLVAPEKYVLWPQKGGGHPGGKSFADGSLLLSTGEYITRGVLSTNGVDFCGRDFLCSSQQNYVARTSAKDAPDCRRDCAALRLLRCPAAGRSYFRDEFLSYTVAMKGDDVVLLFDDKSSVIMRGDRIIEILMPLDIVDTPKLYTGTYADACCPDGAPSGPPTSLRLSTLREP